MQESPKEAVLRCFTSFLPTASTRTGRLLLVGGVKTRIRLGNVSSSQALFTGGQCRTPLPPFSCLRSQNHGSTSPLLDLQRQEDCLEATRNIDEIYALASHTSGSGFLSPCKANTAYNNLLINLYTLEAARTRRIKRYLHASSLTHIGDPSPSLSALSSVTADEAFFRQQTVTEERLRTNLVNSPNP